jgi:hypothetical protein
MNEAKAESPVYSMELTRTELALLHEALLTMKLTAQQRMEMATMQGRNQGEVMFLKDKWERLHELEVKAHALLDPVAATLREEKPE